MHYTYRVLHRMLQIKRLGLHEFKLVLLHYNEQFPRAPTDFRWRVLQNTGYFLLINLHYPKHINCTDNNIGKSVNTNVVALSKASPGKLFKLQIHACKINRLGKPTASAGIRIWGKSKLALLLE